MRTLALLAAALLALAAACGDDHPAQPDAGADAQPCTANHQCPSNYCSVPADLCEPTP